MRAVILILALLVSACTSNLPRESDLNRPRILAVQLDKPTLRPGEFAQGEILIYDPYWRKPTIHWALSLSPLALDQLRTDFPDPATLTPEQGFLYLGQGPQVVTPPYPLNTTAENALAEAGIELFSLPLVAFVDIEGHADRLIGFKQIKLQVTAATQAYLEQDPDWGSLDATEQQRRFDERVELIYNQNPVPVTVQIGTTDRSLAVADRNDLDKRKKLDLDYTSRQAAPGGIVRASLPLTDPDNTLAGRTLVRDQEGYNVLQTAVYMEIAQRTAVDPFTSDFGLDLLDQASAASEPKFEPMAAGIYIGHMVGIDRRGGVVWHSFSIDSASEPPSEARSLDTSVLLRSGDAVFWQAVTADLGAALADATQPVYLTGLLQKRDLSGSVGLASEDRRSAGIPFILGQPAQVTNPTVVLQADQLLNLPTLHGAMGQSVTLPVTFVRFWP